MITRLLLALVFFFVAAPFSLAQTAIGERVSAPFETLMPLLRPTSIVASEIVTVGDLFDHAGRYAETPVFRAPEPGTRGTVPSHHVLDAVRRIGLNEVDLGGLLEITVERAGTRLDSNDFERMVSLALQTQLTELRGEGAGRYALTLANSPAPTMIGSELVDRLVVDLLASPSGRSERFSALIRTPSGAEVARLSGRAEHRVLVPVLGRPIGRGDVIRASDLRMQDIAFNRTMGTPMLVETADIVGQAARRSLRTGSPLGPDDLTEPLMVERQELVTLIYRQGSLALTVRARAMDEGAHGQSIDVMNLQSNQMVRGVVAGHGVVHVLAPMQDIARSSIPQTASPQSSSVVERIQ
ncbi:MAG: flagellar basal body P-ring formation chaperone FlgA [Devosiaceae bacterium]